MDSPDSISLRFYFHTRLDTFSLYGIFIMGERPFSFLFFHGVHSSLSLSRPLEKALCFLRNKGDEPSHDRRIVSCKMRKILIFGRSLAAALL